MAVAPLQLPTAQAYSGGIDWSPLASLGQVYKQGQQQAARDNILRNANFDGSPQSLRALGAQLVQAGDVQSAMTIANLAHQMSTDDLDRTYKLGMLGLEKQKAEKDAPVLTTVGSPDGRKVQAIVNPNKGTVTPIGSPMGDENKLTSVDKKQIFDAEDSQAQLTSTIADLKRAKELAPKAFSGYTAAMRGKIGTNLPGVASAIGIDPEAAKATREFDQIMGAEAINRMSATLKGATTDREMARFTEILADPASPPDLKQATLNRMLLLANRQQQVNESRIKDLRGGTYFKPGGGGSGQPGAVAPATATYTKGQRAQDASGNTIEFNGFAWIPVK